MHFVPSGSKAAGKLLKIHFFRLIYDRFLYLRDVLFIIY